jgi:hypothetical protein
MAAMAPVLPGSARSAARALAWAYSRSAPGLTVPSSSSPRPGARPACLWCAAGARLARPWRPRAAPPSRPRLAHGHGICDAARGPGAWCLARLAQRAPMAPIARSATRPAWRARPRPRHGSQPGRPPAPARSPPFPAGATMALPTAPAWLAMSSAAARSGSARPTCSTLALPLAVAPCVVALCCLARPWHAARARRGCPWRMQHGSRPASSTRRSARQLARLPAQRLNVTLSHFPFMCKLSHDDALHHLKVLVQIELYQEVAH